MVLFFSAERIPRIGDTNGQISRYIFVSYLSAIGGQNGDWRPEFLGRCGKFVVLWCRLGMF